MKQGGKVMKNKRILFTMMAIIFFSMCLTGSLFAAEKATNVRAVDSKLTRPSNITLKPLQQPLAIQQGATISLCASLQGMLQEAGNMAYTDLRNAASMNQTNSSDIRFPGIDAAFGNCIVCTPPENIRNCCQQQQTFSVQDQLAAGCVGSDTIQQCLDKLLRQCIKNVIAKDNVKTKLKQDQQKAEAIAAKAKQLSDKLNLLMNSLP